MAYERPLTLEEARRQLYQHATDDPADANYTFRNALNEALERIDSHGIWEGQKARILDTQLHPLITADILTLPKAYESMIAVNIDDGPRSIFEDTHEFSANGPGTRDAGEGGSIVIDLGFNLVNGQYLRQYKFTEATANAELEALFKLRFQSVTINSDIVVPSNVGALKHAILAICYENEGALAVSLEYWAECTKILSREKETSNTGVIKTMPQNPWGVDLPTPQNLY